MKILIVGSGGREHALSWKIASSPLVEKLFCAPGNAGIADIAECIDISTDNTKGLVHFATSHAIDLVVVGPEDPLVAGLVDVLEAAGIKAFGPGKEAARLEGSKKFMKDLAAAAGVPTAFYESFRDADAAIAYIQDKPLPIVIKTDGLAAGKGVIIAETHQEAEKAIKDMILEDAFGDAGHQIVIEEFLDGEELSFFALVDGKTALPLASAQDHKRAYDGDKGPNTGGMGAYSPAPLVTPDIHKRIMEEVIHPTVTALRNQGMPFKGILFAGIMVDKAGNPKLLEYNIRFGDPECQVLMTRLKSDLVPALLACCEGKLDTITLEWSGDAAIVVVMAAQGYPGAYEKNTEIKGLSGLESESLHVFYAGTKKDAAGRILSTGGRVLGITANAEDLSKARDTAYAAIAKIDWPQGFYRDDIGWRALKSDKKGS